VHGAVQDAVDAEKSRLLVELVLDLGALGDLDDGGEALLDPRAQLDIVPGVNGHDLFACPARRT
jgi:hypothetical protein